MKKITSILLVDDDMDDRDLFSEALSWIDGSIKMEFASNGLEAIGKLESGEISPDAIFSDINMPLMNGIQLIEKISKSELLNKLPVVIYTTSSSQFYQSQTKLLGVKHYIVKPTSFEKICSEIKLALEHLKKLSVNSSHSKKLSLNQMLR